jgi:hypothetical protein
MEIKKFDLLPNPREIEVESLDAEIYLTITIGNGQIGGSKIKDGDTYLAKGDLSTQTSLGKASELKDKTLDFRTNVLDVNQSTNKCVISTEIVNEDHKVLFSKTDNGDAPADGIASFVGSYVVRVTTVLLVLCMNIMAFAQNDLSFQNMQTPASPGFILLDQTPSAIERPTTPQGFGASVLGLFSGSGGAMEVTPFWLTDHKNLKAEDIYKKHGEFIQNFAVSAAHVLADSVGYISFGARTSLFRSYGKKQTAKLDSLKKALILMLAEVDDNSSLDALEAARQEYANLILKPIFTIDLAGAIAGSSPTNSYNDLQSSRWAMWASLNWRPKGDDFYVTVLGRYIGNNRFAGYVDGSNLIDIGARANYDIGKFSASFEYLQRFDVVSTTTTADNRLAAIGSYQLSDKFYLTATFGKDFSGVDNMIAMAGVNFGFSKSKVTAF